MAFRTPTDIANKALFHLGASRITGTDSLAAPLSKNATTMAGVYDDSRLAELQRNVWTFATRRTILRPITSTSVQFSPPAYAAGTTYSIGDMVVDSGGVIWVSMQAGNLGNTPGVTPAIGNLFWDVYFGPLWLDQWNETQEPQASTNESYDPGELVYITPGDGTYVVYQSLVTGNTNQPNGVDAWSATLMYAAGAVVSYNGANYQSRVNFNFNFTPATSATQWTSTVTNPLVSLSWRAVASATIVAPIINWPVSAGPEEDVNSRNVYPLPAGYLKEAPQKPKAGVNPYLGMPRNLPADDWEFTGSFIVTSQTGPVAFRFVADVEDVTTFDAMFCEGLAVRLAFDTCEDINQDTAKQAGLGAKYRVVMGEARIVNAIEQGPVEPVLEQYLTVRL